jgi:hypothetical protein
VEGRGCLTCPQPDNDNGRGCTLGEAVSPTSQRSSLDDVIDAYKPGIDVTLIDENLRRSVDEWLRNLQRMLEFAEELRRAGRELAKKT